jgi:hypothetical protein
MYSDRRRTAAHLAATRSAASRAYYYLPRRAYLSPPRVVRAGPAFALLIPAQFKIETQPPEPGHHQQAAPRDIVGAGTELVLVLAVVLVAARGVVLWLIDEAGRVLAVLRSGPD